LTASYTDDSNLPEGFERKIAIWKVAAPPAVKGGADAKLKARISLNLHGMLVLDSVTQLEEEEYEEVVKKPSSKVSPPPPPRILCLVWASRFRI
jgi:hypothetical protein